MIDYPTTEILSKLNIPWMLMDYYEGPLWTGCMIIYPPDDYGDPALFHEFCHWAVATKKEKESPDYGLGQHVNGSGSDFHNGYFENKSEDVDYGRYLSWGDEQRVHIDVSATREVSAVLGAGLYEKIFGKSELANHVMNEFGFYNQTDVDNKIINWGIPRIVKQLNKAGYDIDAKDSITYIRKMLNG